MSGPPGGPSAPRVSVVLPAFNEEKVLPSTLERVHGYFARAGTPFEILPIDDGSGDRTAEVARAFAASHPECRPLRNEMNRGKGYTVLRGIREARAELVLFSDADLSTPIEECEKLFQAVERGADIAIGSRDLPESDVRVRQPWYRETMGRVFNRIVRVIVLPGFVDTQCGFKALRRASFLPLLPLLTIDRYSFDVEVLFVARKHGLSIREIPVVWLNRTETRVDPLRDSSRMLVDLLRIRYYDFRGRYQKPAQGVSSRESGGKRPSEDHRGERE